MFQTPDITPPVGARGAHGDGGEFLSSQFVLVGIDGYGKLGIGGVQGISRGNLARYHGIGHLQ